MKRRDFLAVAAGGFGMTLRRPEVAPVFDGIGGHVEIPDSPDFSQPTRGALTVEAWLKPYSTRMPRVEGSGYVHWLGKGEPHEHEWVARMYQAGNREGRANRISFYAFNLFGGLGAGSYYQDPIEQQSVWFHVVGRIDAVSTALFFDGADRDNDPLDGYAIRPRNGKAPVRIGTRDLQSYFHGAISRVAIYGAALSEQTIARHYQARGTSAYDALVLGDPGLVAYWKLGETFGKVAADATGHNPGRYVGGVKLGESTWNPE